MITGCSRYLSFSVGSFITVFPFVHGAAVPRSIGRNGLTVDIKTGAQKSNDAERKPCPHYTVGTGINFHHSRNDPLPAVGGYPGKQYSKQGPVKHIPVHRFRMMTKTIEC